MFRGNKLGSDRAATVTEEQIRARDTQAKLQREIHEGISLLSRRLQGLQTHQSTPLGDEPGVRVITLAGNNSGATMNLGSEPASDPGFRCGRPYQDEAGRVGEKRSAAKFGGKRERPPVEAFVNSNVQSVNNSIAFNSSCSHRDPGVHLDLNSCPAPIDGSAKSGGSEDSVGGIRVTPKKKSWGKNVMSSTDLRKQLGVRQSNNKSSAIEQLQR